MTSWEFFDYLLENVNVVGTPDPVSDQRRALFPSDGFRKL